MPGDLGRLPLLSEVQGIIIEAYLSGYENNTCPRRTDPKILLEKEELTLQKGSFVKKLLETGGGFSLLAVGCWLLVGV